MPSKLLAQLAEPGAKPSGEALSALSGLHTKALHDFHVIWARITVARRCEILLALQPLLEANATLDFSAVATAALADPVTVELKTGAGASAGKAACSTEATVGPASSMEMTICAPDTATPSSASGLAPASASACALACVRFHTVTGWPAASRRRTIGSPIKPMPKKVICVDNCAPELFSEPRYNHRLAV